MNIGILVENVRKYQLIYPKNRKQCKNRCIAMKVWEKAPEEVDLKTKVEVG